VVPDWHLSSACQVPDLGLRVGRLSVPIRYGLLSGSVAQARQTADNLAEASAQPLQAPAPVTNMMSRLSGNLFESDGLHKVVCEAVDVSDGGTVSRLF
jgi:hypothetical protein